MVSSERPLKKEFPFLSVVCTFLSPAAISLASALALPSVGQSPLDFVMALSASVHLK